MMLVLDGRGCNHPVAGRQSSLQYQPNSQSNVIHTADSYVSSFPSAYWHRCSDAALNRHVSAWLHLVLHQCELQVAGDQAAVLCCAVPWCAMPCHAVLSHISRACAEYMMLSAPACVTEAIRLVSGAWTSTVTHDEMLIIKSHPCCTLVLIVCYVLGLLQGYWQHQALHKFTLLISGRHKV